MQGECHWHKHDSDDEFLFVLDGEFVVDLADRSVTSKSREGFAVPKGFEHRRRAPQRAGILMEEDAGSILSGD
jgi:mannose-6-phosphate isomerase-like protein (cupin superfamily)